MPAGGLRGARKCTRARPRLVKMATRRCANASVPARANVDGSGQPAGNTMRARPAARKSAAGRSA
eukprot:11178077-Lingulodinium_polyedra.AAC.1